MSAVKTLPEGSRGFDCNQKITPAIARLFVAAGYSFAVRYVRRSTHHDYDVTAGELLGLLEMGLGFMIVQHVAAPGWMPTGVLGANYGDVAVAESLHAGVPLGTSVWCDLEGVDHSAAAADVIAYCNAWHEKVGRAGFTPGLYVGDSCGLTASQLYRNLRFEAYWSAYNLNRDNVPAVRGVQMRQKPYPTPPKRVPDVPFEYDEDVIGIDALGGTPLVCLP